MCVCVYYDYTKRLFCYHSQTHNSLLLFVCVFCCDEGMMMRVSVVCHAECIVCVYYLLLWKQVTLVSDDDAFRLSVVRPNPNHPLSHSPCHCYDLCYHQNLLIGTGHNTKIKRSNNPNPNPYPTTHHVML